MAAAAQLSLTQLSSGNPVYEKYYRQVEAGNTGRVLALDAAAFLKKSGLPDLILGKIWDLADTDGKGVLSKQEFFVALRLVACAQNGLEVSLSSLSLAVPPPRFHDSSSPLLTSGPSVAELPWAVKSEDKAKYDAIFDSLSPVDGFLSGDKVKPVLLNSKLPVEILGRVWELSDIDHDGKLDRDEFAVAMFLVYCALEKEPVPMSLPPALVPPSKRKTWVVSPAEKAKYDEIFLKTDKDMDGYVSGLEVRETFLKTGLPSALLAHIWSLCDTKGCGKLSKDQFALAFHLINQKLIKGIDPPHSLTPEMIPPSDRSSLQKNITGSSPVADFSAIKELDTLNNEIVDLQREKNNVEQDLKEKEDTVKQRTSEVQDLQDEVQRESINLQKLQAQKQQVQELLGELDEQKAQLEEQLQEVRKKCAEEAQLISSLKAEITSQESQISSYEEELLKAREELSRLQQETAQLEESVESGKAQLEPLQQHLQESQQEISSMQMRLEMKDLETDNNQSNWSSSPQSVLVNGATDYCSLSTSSSETANFNEHAEGQNNLESEPTHQESSVRSSPEIAPSDVTDESEAVTVAGNEKVTPRFDDDKHSKEEDPFNVESSSLTDAVADTNLDFFQSDPFVGSDPFKDDPFGKIDPFGGDPFKGSDPFASDCFFKQTSTDPFTTSSTDPFSASSNSSNTSVETWKHNDPFAPGGTVVAAASDSATDPFASVFGNESFGDGFADFSTLSKVNNEDAFNPTISSSTSSVTIAKPMLEETASKSEDVPPALPPKVGTPTRPCPPPPGKRPINKLDSSDPLKLNDPFQPFPGNDSPKEKDPDMFCDPFTSSTTTNKEADPSNFANFSAYPSEEDMIEWAKRESEREEEQRLARLNQQEQEDLELAIALSKSEISEA
ncbi:epidermal growth factor receptor substrate 15 isoform A [Mus musculus]|uniref:Epidermal growth factor receptor substrate 15 n=2 Tax=Mus musculus TaxID=10090 RepID=EPS15_MOUSE|nr:epidermal growth factor receptor substrate 15 isoform A [Mus musculus]P42567.1 RecName: Full=Epidermal growth factor receptor substrate 15; Short=Protein Eps15; AltName: Full=Protein AF-1p [Mus musculus]AAA02912.1 eps15 [Mus musculus]AAH48783.2 Epidermal growth factor receptor pathway substrate 15 [Mus musculus]|eukprot:NP_031969.1 epidermal growth factor receptor substrate 15 isoform A [Mus musculus]